MESSWRVLATLGAALAVCAPVFLVLHATTVTAAAAAGGQETDMDGDTMPDAWESFFGLNPNDPSDASGDPDGDGVTNAQEYAARRHPVGRHVRYFAEGATGFFDTSVALVNLSATDTAHIALALSPEGGAPISHQVTLGPRQRRSISINSVLGGMTAAVSVIVESDVPVAADRTMTWGAPNGGLSLDSGSPAPATTWYFAEGATGSFLLYYLFQNPATTPAQVTVRYLSEGAAPITKIHTLPPQSRTTIFVNQADPALAVVSVAATVTSDVPILAERAMYLTSGAELLGGSASSGSDRLSTQWYFGEGATGPFFHAFLSLLNPGATASTATVTFHMSNGGTASKDYVVAPGTRRTVYFNAESQTDASLAPLSMGPVWFSVTSTQPIAAERAMWWPFSDWYEGHAGIGSVTPGVGWAVPGGQYEAPGAQQTFILVGNAGATAGTVRFTLIDEAGGTATRELPIGAQQRLTVEVGTLFELTSARFSVLVDSIGASPVPIVVDYARYASSFGQTFKNGGVAPAVLVTGADVAPTVTATTPANGATGASSSNNLTVTFSESVNVADGAFILQCPTGTPITLTNLTASPATTFTLDPAVSLPPVTACTLTVVGALVTDADTIDPPDAMAADVTATFTTAVENAPTVTSTTPAAGATSVSASANVTITFSEPVDVTGNWFTIVCGTSGTRTVADTVVTGGPTTFTIDPTTNFAEGESCTVTVVAAQVTDQDAVDPPDTMAADHVFGFSLNLTPQVTSTVPTNGALQVSTAADLTVTFSEPVTVTGNWFQMVCSVTGTRNVADTVVSGGPTTYSVNPNVDFAAGELCTATIVATQVSDQDSVGTPHTLAADYVFSFTTDTPPAVTATTPVNGSTTATLGTSLTVTFDEPVSVTGNWFTIVCTTSGTRNLSDTIVTGGPTTFTIDPTADFAAGESCTVTIAAAAVSDLDAGDPPDTLVANHVFTFTLDAAPSVTATTPVEAATVAVSTDITITFSEPVDVTGNWFTIVCTTSGTHNVSDTVVSGGPTSFTINPTLFFAAGESCTVTVIAAQVSDQDGDDPPDTMAANYAFTFATDATPSVTSTTPVNGATVTANTDLTITFSEAVDAAGNWFQIVCATTGTRNVSDTVVTGGPTTFTINPNADFAAGELCTVTVFAAQVTDQDALDPPNNMNTDYVFSFTGDQAPAVSATTPANGATAIGTTTDLSVTFTEPVDVAGNWFQVVCATSGTRNVGDTVVTGGPTTFTINPTADFAAGELCTVTVVAAQVTDQDAADPPNAMVANYVFSFTTDLAPSVTSTAPTDGSTGSTTNTNLIITFSEPVTVTGNWFQIVCTVTGTRNVADTSVLGGPTAWTIDPSADFAPGESCTVTTVAAAVSDQDAGDPPDTMAANHVFTFTMDAQPSVTATTPVDAAVVTGASNVVITFSEAVNVTGNWFAIVCTTSGTRNVADTIVSGGPTTFTINPNVDFTGGESCTVTVVAAQVSDQDGIDPPDTMAANHVFGFSVDAAPGVTATTPTNGSTTATTTTDLTLTFNEAVNVTGNWFQIVCATSGTRNVADTGVTGGPTTFTVNPNVDFAAGELCTVTVFAAQVTDQDAVDPPDTMTANFVFSFTTDAAPAVTSTTPTNGAVQVASNTNLSLTFNEAVDVTGNWFQIVCTTSGTRNVADTVVTGGPTTFGINPNTDLASGETCTVTVFAAQVTDQDSADPPDGMAANFVFSFTVDSAPSVTTTAPTNGAIGVLPSTTITVNFSESVNATTSSFTVQCPTANHPFTLSASPAATFTLTPTTALPEGVICTVTVLAAQITDADAGDPPDNMLANYVFSFSIPPNAVNDARSATGNVSLNTVGSGFTVLANDIGPGIAITASDATSVRGGTVVVDTGTGRFTYNPPVGYEGTDSFNYTITNVAGSDIGTVTMTVSGMLWFIDDSATACTTIAGGCGRLSNPFSTLAAFNTVNGGATVNGADVVDPEAGDHVFLYSGSYAGGLTVENTQRIIGQGALSALQTLSGITPATDSATLPSTGGTKPSLTGAGFTLANGNQLYGLAFSGTSGFAIASSGSVGTLLMGDITINNTSGGGISLTGGGTVTATGTNDITTTTGTALNVVNTTIGASHMTFHSISANGAASGIILNNTGASGSLIVTGNATNTVGGDNSGGIIQNTTGSGIRLTSTTGPSFRNVRVFNTTGSGVRGTQVTNFTFRNGTIDQSDDDGAGTVNESNIAFNDTVAGTENNVSGVVTITDNVLTNALFHGVDLFNNDGTLSSVTITGNTITSATSLAASQGSGIRLIAFGSATTVANVTNATIATNIITNFPSGAGITAQGGNANAAGAAGTFGTAGNGSQIIAITGNRIAGQGGGASQGMGTYAIQASVNGKGTGNFNISNNGTVANPITNIEGNVISNSSLGIATVTSTISNNVIDANHQADFGGPFGISTGSGATSGIGDTASLTITISGNTITDTDGNGIIASAREGNSSLVARILNNSVAAPLGGFRPGIRIDSGVNTSVDNTVCLEISGNTSAGSGDVSTTAPGIGLRKEGTSSTVHAFGIEGLSPSPTGTPTVENWVNSQNPGSASGINFGVGGTALISATTGFTSCTAP